MYNTIFFSDLDRTLIFSERFSRYQDILVEKKPTKSISYMTHHAVQLLEAVRNETLFIPVTTRTKETSLRVDFIRDNLPMWMVTNNGAHIWENGILDIEYAEKIELQKKEWHNQLQDTKKIMNNLLIEESIKDLKVVEGMYLVYKLEHISSELKSRMREFSENSLVTGFRVEVNSKKMYVFPDYIRKEIAVEYLLNKIPHHKSIGAGDSSMDAGFLSLTDYPIKPSHATFHLNKSHITNSKGIEAGEEILHMAQHIHRYYRKEQEMYEKNVYIPN